MDETLQIGNDHLGETENLSRQKPLVTYLYPTIFILLNQNVFPSNVVIVPIFSTRVFLPALDNSLVKLTRGCDYQINGTTSFLVITLGPFIVSKLY
jgi:hypothetical protein